ncbi:MAG TPA: ADP-ribosyltransferase [Anaerolineae bacterium]|nr:ADP-ribosyltransferase [Anaerolineae bacterium]
MRRRLDGQEREVMDALGDPPDLANLTREFWDTEAGAMLADLRPEIERMALDSVAAAGTTVPIVWDEVVIAREAADWAGRYSYELIRDLTGNTQRLVTDQVGRFVQTPGMTIGQLRDSLTPAFGDSRAQAIAVTETTRAYAQGNRLVQDSLRRAGLEMTRYWNTSGSDVCDLCIPLDDKPEDEWGEHSNGPPAHPRCRCWTTMRRRREAAAVGPLAYDAPPEVQRAQDVTASEQRALQSYQTSGYHAINEGLRGGGKIPPDVQREISKIDAAITKSTVKANTTVYRGGSTNWLEREGRSPSDLVGLVIEDNGYLSASVKRETADWFAGAAIEEGKKPALWDIRLPTGSNALDLSGQLQEFGAGEAEWLLPRGAKLRIVDVGQTTISVPHWGEEYQNVPTMHIVAEWLK